MTRNKPFPCHSLIIIIIRQKASRRISSIEPKFPQGEDTRVLEELTGWWNLYFSGL